MHVGAGKRTVPAQSAPAMATQSKTLPNIGNFIAQTAPRVEDVTGQLLREVLEPRGFEPLTSSMPLRRSTT
jgi:hypothetical protein